MKIKDLLNELREDIPFEQRKNLSFVDNVREQHKLFLDKISKIDEDDLSLFLKGKEKLTKKKLEFRLKKITDKLEDIIEKYYLGLPAEAYRGLKKLLFHVSYIRNLSDVYHGFFRNKEFEKSQIIDFYRLRDIKGTCAPFAQDLFHAPFQKRGIVSSSRFSIPGFPCLYLGRSLCVSYLEIEPENPIFASRFEVNLGNYHAKPLNLTCPEVFTEEIYSDFLKKSDAIAFLLTFPVIQICLYKVKDNCKNDNFKPEYIIPQLLLQLIKHEEDGYFDSIIYTSTKTIDNKTNEKYHNLVLPVQVTSIQNEGYCSKLKSKVKITDPVEIKSTCGNGLDSAEAELKNKIAYYL